MPTTPVALFCCYAPADAASYSELKKHLGLLLHQGRIRLWHQGDIPAGALLVAMGQDAEPASSPTSTWPDKTCFGVASKKI